MQALPNEQQTVAAIGDAYARYNYVIDRHTAVGYRVAMNYHSDNKKVILSTASPYKFPKSVIEGIGGNTDVDNEFELFDILNEKTGVAVPASLARLKNAVSRFNDSCEKEQMPQKVYEFLGL